MIAKDDLPLTDCIRRHQWDNIRNCFYKTYAHVPVKTFGDVFTIDYYAKIYHANRLINKFDQRVKDTEICNISEDEFEVMVKDLEEELFLLLMKRI